MKVYRNEDRLCIVGKVWQVRAKLRQLSQSPLTLEHFLQGDVKNNVLQFPTSRAK